MPLIDCFYKGKINYYINSNEQNGCHAAVGYAKSTNKTGVMITTSGPGITNCITPILDSTNDSTPLVVFSGQVSLNTMGSCAFQESPATEITKPITKWSYCVKDISELDSVIDEAFYIANDKKKGAVHIDLPKCIISSKTKYVDHIDKIYEKTNEDIFNLKIADKINKSEKPVLYIGQGCNNYSEELRKLVDKFQLPITTTMHAMGAYDERNELSLQMCGMHGSYVANKALQNADCIIAIGARFDDRTTGLPSKYAPIAKNNKAIIHCNIENSEIDKNIKSNYSYTGDAGIFINHLIENLEIKERKLWLNQLNIWKNQHPFEFKNAGSGQIKTQNVLVELNKQTQKRDDIIYTFGVGNHLMMGCQFLDWKDPKTILASGSLGVMGCSIGYSIGAQIANLDKTIISIDGDGSFNMTLTDLKTIKEYNLPIKIAIINDESLSMVRIWEKLFFEERYVATDNPNNPDYVNLAKSYGIHAISCDSIDELGETINEFLECKDPILCEFKVIGEECLPLVGPGKALDDMILFRDYNNIDLSDCEVPC